VGVKKIDAGDGQAWWMFFGHLPLMGLPTLYPRVLCSMLPFCVFCRAFRLGCVGGRESLESLVIDVTDIESFGGLQRRWTCVVSELHVEQSDKELGCILPLSQGTVYRGLYLACPSSKSGLWFRPVFFVRGRVFEFPNIQCLMAVVRGVSSSSSSSSHRQLSLSLTLYTFFTTLNDNNPILLVLIIPILPEQTPSSHLLFYLINTRPPIPPSPQRSLPSNQFLLSLALPIPFQLLL
jgi:hypothetical protein